MDLEVTVTPDLEDELVRRAPWMHPFRLSESVIVGRFKDRVPTTVCVSSSPSEEAAAMRQAYADYMEGDPYWNVRAAFERVGGTGKSFLDIASATGRFSFALADAGAGSVLGVEIRREQVDQAELLRRLDGRFANVRFEHEPTSADDPAFREGESYDVVLSMGLLYHLTDPVTHLRVLRRLAREAVLVETLTHARERDYWLLELEDPQGITKAWGGVSWIPHYADVPELLRRVGFSSVEVIESPQVAELHRLDDRRPGATELVLPGAGVKVLNRLRTRRLAPMLREATRLRLAPRYYTYLART